MGTEADWILLDPLKLHFQGFSGTMDEVPFLGSGCYGIVPIPGTALESLAEALAAHDL